MVTAKINTRTKLLEIVSDLQYKTLVSDLKHLISPIWNWYHGENLVTEKQMVNINVLKKGTVYCMSKSIREKNKHLTTAHCKWKQ